MLEQWVGKVVTYYVIQEDSYNERKLVKVDLNGIYAQDTEDDSTTFFVPFSSIRSISYTKS